MNMKYLGAIVLVIGIAVIGYYVLNTPDHRSDGQKVNDAISALPKGIDKAADELKSRTPGEKLNDAAQDIGADVKKSINQ